MRLLQSHIRLILLHVLAFLILPIYALDVEPILGDIWRHQSAPFNIYCPQFDNSEERCQVGCVATACETIMTNYGRFITLNDTLYGWTNEHYTIENVLPGQTLQCSNEDVEAQARLGYWLGVACHMNYGLGASGANVHRLEAPLRSVFGWKYVHYLDSYKYTADKWREIINKELVEGRPVLYAGYTADMSGHAFVIDGVREDGLYHINWGYGGSYDQGWHSLDELVYSTASYDRRAEDVPHGFFANHEMLLIHPDSISNPLLADTLSRTGHEITVSAELPEVLVADRYFPIRFTFTNITEDFLTTPFELFANTPEESDSLSLDSLFIKGNYGALYGLTLSPREQRTVTFAARFSQAGQRILRLSPDDKTIVWKSSEVTILPSAPAQARFSDPQITAHGTTVHIELSVTNEGQYPLGENLLYCLFQGDHIPEPADNEPRHHQYYYTAPGQTETFSMDFKGLQPDTDYTLLLRNPWTPLNAQGYTFHTPTIAEQVLGPTYNLTTKPYELPLGPVTLSIDGKHKKILHP